MLTLWHRTSWTFLRSLGSFRCYNRLSVSGKEADWQRTLLERPWYFTMRTAFCRTQYSWEFSVYRIFIVSTWWLNIKHLKLLSVGNSQVILKYCRSCVRSFSLVITYFEGLASFFRYLKFILLRPAWLCGASILCSTCCEGLSGSFGFCSTFRKLSANLASIRDPAISLWGLNI